MADAACVVTVHEKGHEIGYRGLQGWGGGYNAPQQAEPEGLHKAAVQSRELRVLCKMSLENFTANLIPRILAAEDGGVAVIVVPGDGEAGDAATVVAAAIGGGGQNGGVFVPASRADAAGTAVAAAAAAWSDARPLSEQLPSYPATCLLAGVFVTVRRGGRGGVSKTMLFC